MFVPCPHCGFLVALILPSPAAGPDGAVPRCPHCDGALRIDNPELTDPMDSDPTASAEPGVPLAGAEADRADTDSPPAPVASPAEPSAETAATAPPAASTAMPSATRTACTRRPPSFVRGNTPARAARLAWPWYVAITVLALLLALQLLLAQRHELATSARWRPWVENLCNILPCEIPPWREPQAFTMLDRSVQPSQSMPGVLAVQASFRNDARWPQPWPTLLLGLSDVEGRQVGMGAFAPAKYRVGAAADELLGPGQIATVRLQVREPAPRIVAFTFDFQ